MRFALRKLDIYELAYNECKKFQNEEEAKLNFRKWKKYVFHNFGYGEDNGFTSGTDVGEALVKSGLGIHNIDQYLHKNQMQSFFVNSNSSLE